LLRPTGEVSFSSRPELVGTRAWEPRQLEPGVVTVSEAGQFAVLRPLVNEVRCLRCHGPESHVNGWLDVRFSRAPLGAAQGQLSRILVLVTVPSLGFLLLITWWLLGREAIKPIHRLVKAMRRAEAGDEHARADEGRPDEFGVAARGFDATLAALRRSQAELEAVYRDRMLRADRFAAVGEMASGLAHEIKNPLAGLSGALELLAEDLSGSPEKSEVVGEMRHQVDRLTRTMEGLLSFARPPRPNMGSTDVNATLEKVLFLVARQRSKVPVRFVRELDPALPRVMADSAQLEQVFLNICLNACQAMAAAGGTLTVSSAARGDRVAVDLTDTGPGIPQEIRSNVFTPFFTTRKNGTGLGLAISSRIVAEHGGQIVFTCPPGGGTTFTVSLPLEGLPKEQAA
ncbi:MAG: two-component system sensor histidine kinase NtrB, partial [Myxococcaceae bacterium]